MEPCQKVLKENIIVYLGTFCGKSHIAVLPIHELSHLIRMPPKENTPLSHTYDGSGSAGKLLFIMLFCNLMFSFGLYFSLRQFL